jgi:hypothetical protein
MSAARDNAAGVSLPAACSQGQIANVLRGHDRLSAAVTRRLHKILLTQV